MLLKDKVLLVTGGGSGIGRATALRFHSDGAAVAVVDRDYSQAELVANIITNQGGRALAIEADVSKETQVKTMIETILTHFGRLDGASNNAAAGGSFCSLHEIEQKYWDLVTNVTLKGVWLCMKYEIPALLKSGGGAIVNIASLSGVRGEALQAPYSAAKGGVIALTKTGAAEYAQQGIRVNAIAPGAIQTPSLDHYFDHVESAREQTEGVHAMRRIGQPEEIADSVCYLLSDRASFITGELIEVSGGVTVNPHTL